jgi:hypothetical protein
MDLFLSFWMILIIAWNKFIIPEELNLENGEPGV